MKQLYSLLFMLALTLGCKHESLVHEFAVVCDFSIFNPHILLITNEVGDVVHEIPIQPGTSAIYERFLMPTDDPDATFGLHLLQRYSVDWTQYFNVYSHCGVKNGMHIVLGAAESLTNTLKRASRPARPTSTSPAFDHTPIFLNRPTKSQHEQYLYLKTVPYRSHTDRRAEYAADLAAQPPEGDVSEA